MFFRKLYAAKTKKVNAFTMMDALVTMAIVGILVLLALPKFLTVITKAKSTEAQINLGHIHTLEATYGMINSKYSSNLTEIGFEANKLVTEGGNANYRYEISSAAATSFKARATAVVDFDNDGTFNMWEIDQDKKLTEVTPD